MKTKWSYLILGSLIFLAQSDGMARSYSTYYDYGSRNHNGGSSYSSGNTGSSSSTDNNSSVDAGNSSTNTASDGTSGAGNSCNTAQSIIEDMTASPSSPPRSPWDNGWAKIEVGNDAPSWANALTGWGGILRDASNSDDSNTAVEVRNMRIYLLHKSGKWETLNATTDVGYAGYKEDFSDTAPLDEARTMPDGGIAVKIPKGSVFHFWPSDNNVVNVDTSDIGGILVTFQARLIVNDPSKPDDTSIAHYLGVAGADYYGNGKCCGEDSGEIGMGRYKFVTTEWRWYNFTTVPVSQIAATQPPVGCQTTSTGR
jgi:hypothetical protein